MKQFYVVEFEVEDKTNPFGQKRFHKSAVFSADPSAKEVEVLFNALEAFEKTIDPSEMAVIQVLGCQPVQMFEI